MSRAGQWGQEKGGKKEAQPPGTRNIYQDFSVIAIEHFFKEQ